MASRNATTYNIPNTVTEIGQNAFYWCNKMTSITIPDSVTVIGAGAFGGCSSLKEITIPQSVTSIGADAFIYCGNLTAFPTYIILSSTSCIIYTPGLSGSIFSCSSMLNILSLSKI